MNNMTKKIFTIGLILAAIIPSVAMTEEKDKYAGEFYNSGKHFQLDGEVVLIAEDGIHDPSNITAMYGLQLPADAMGQFPRDNAGLIDWVKTLNSGLIAPRSDINGTGPDLKPIDLDILFSNTGAMPKVLFPHKQHTQWLACKNCHDDIFKQKKGSSKFKMVDVLNGKYCGVCHGKIAFSPTRNCMRCHSVKK